VRQANNTISEDAGRAVAELGGELAQLICGKGKLIDKLPELRAVAAGLDCCKTLVSVARALHELESDDGGASLVVEFGEEIEEYFN
jgi:hypothetical protein